ncbi:MAG: fibronectin type III domain-containing protein [Acidobacteriaceae bacterium]
MAVRSPLFQRFSIFQLSVVAGVGLPLTIVLGCGMVAVPQAPSLKLPEPVTNLTAKRVGDLVELDWTMPKRTTDKVLLKGKQEAELCRRAGSASCARVATLKLAPEAAGSFVDTLPPALASGPLRPLVYTVELKNESGRSAGPSNEAVTAAGAAPPQTANLSAQAQADGVVLSWTATGGEETVRIHRVLVEKKGVPKVVGVAAEQTLEFTGRDQGRVLDHDAALDHTYTYTVQRVAKEALEGRTVEVASAPSASITINARDLFPPAPPEGLQAVADAEGHSIDLSWQPDTEADLVGYRIYRREAGANEAPTRVGAVEAGASFRDTSALPGRTYEYSVSAVDRDGNESARSAEVEEMLPQE